MFSGKADCNCLAMPIIKNETGAKKGLTTKKRLKINVMT